MADILIVILLLLAALGILAIIEITYDRQLQRQLDRDIAHFNAVMEQRNRNREL